MINLKQQLILIIMETYTKLNFLEAENVALNLAYKQFYGEGNAIGMAFVFIKDRKSGNLWSDEEKKIALNISNEAITKLKNINLTNLIVTGVVPNCAMGRRFMSTGSGRTSSGYNY